MGKKRQLKKTAAKLIKLIREVPQVGVDEGHNRESREPIKKRERRLENPWEQAELSLLHGENEVNGKNEEEEEQDPLCTIKVEAEDHGRWEWGVMVAMRMNQRKKIGKKFEIL